MEQCHTNKLFPYLFQFLAMNDADTQKEILKSVAEEERKVHGSNISKTMLCLKNNYNKYQINIIIDFLNPSCLSRWLPCVESFTKIRERHRLIWYSLHSLKQISFVYIDITKDVMITFTLIILTGGFESLFEFPTVFTSAVVFSFIGSIIVPLILSSAQLAKNHPDLIYGDNFYQLTKKKQILVRFGIVLMSFIIPAILIQIYEKNQELLKFQDSKKKRTYKDVEQIVKRGEEIKLQYVKFIRTELGFEVIFQIAGQIILLLQSTTDTSTVNGLGKVQYV